MPIYLILHKVPQGPNQPSLFEEVVMSYIQKDRTSQKIELLRSAIATKGSISVLENTKWGAIIVSSDLTAEQVFNEIKSHVSTYVSADEIELLVFGISEWGGFAAPNTINALQSVISDFQANNNSHAETVNSARSNLVAENLKRISFSIVRCRHCNNPAMYGGDVCYTCNSK